MGPNGWYPVGEPYSLLSCRELAEEGNDDVTGNARICDRVDRSLTSKRYFFAALDRESCIDRYARIRANPDPVSARYILEL